jgi:hypothetical protein
MTGKRRVFLIILGIAILGMLGLAIGLTGLSLLPGDLLILSGMLQIGNYQGFDMPGGQALLQFIRIIYLLAIVTLPIMMIYLIISPTARRRLLKFLLRSLPFFLGLYLFILFLKRLQGDNTSDTPLLLGAPAKQAVPGVIPPLAPIPDPSETAIVLISVILSLVMVSIIGVALWLLWRRSKPDLSPNRLIARQAQSALDALQAGGDLKNTIIRCYYQMSAVINQQRGIQRSKAMTPHEFEQYLATNGLPGEPVHQLTHLFEEVRYGDLPAGAAEEQAALNSLTAIIEACGGKA